LRTSLRLISTFLLWFLILAVSSSLAMLIAGSGSGPPTWQVGLVTHTAMLLLSLLLMFWLGRGSLKSFGFARPNSLGLLTSAVWGLILGAGVTIGVALIGGAAAMPDHSMPIPQQILFVWLWASLCEEIFLRGLIQSNLHPLASRGVKVFGTRFSLPVIISALLFGLMHLGLVTTRMQLSVVLIVVIFSLGLGIAAGYYRERSLSLIPAVLVHVFGNIGGSLVEWMHLGL